MESTGNKRVGCTSNARNFARKGVCTIASAALVMMLGWGFTAPRAEAESSDENVIEIVNSSDLKKLAENPGSYAGKTVKLMYDLNLSGTWKPIGTKAEPFTGTFDGNNHSISGLKVTGKSYLGLFGCVGVGGKIKNLTISNGDDDNAPSVITATSSENIIRHVGSIAGYVYGELGSDSPAIENCTSEATVTVTSTMKPSSKKSKEFVPEDDVESGYSDQGVTIEYIGGLVGYCAGSIADSKYIGTVSATTHELPQSEDEATMGTAVGGIAGQVGGFTVSQKISDTDKMLVKAQYPQADGTYSIDTDDAQNISNCTNTGEVITVADADGGLDRFGKSVSTTFSQVGGIVGYSMADVVGCENDGNLNCPTAIETGGVVGCVRALPHMSTNSAVYDAGEQFKAEKSGSTITYTKLCTGPTLVVRDCTMAASVKGRAQVGGVVGSAGTHTDISFCKTTENGQSDQELRGMRWNKPMVGGIVGQTFGNVSYCYNKIDCYTDTGGGYFVAGIAGSLTTYSSSDNDAATSPTPNLGACYFTGVVHSGEKEYANGTTYYHQGGVVGENYGYVHDSYCIEGHVLNVTSTETYVPMVGENHGSVSDATVQEISAEEMQEKSFCGKLNANTSVDAYQAGEDFFLPAADGENDGYPVFASDPEAVKGSEELTESELSQEGQGLAEYRADANPVPALSLTYGEDQLVQGADYYVLPDENALDDNGKTRDVSSLGGDETFSAKVVGIGKYESDATGVPGFTASYQIGRGEFSSCTAVIVGETFDYKAHELTSDKITVYDAAGGVVPSDQYTFSAPENMVDYGYTYSMESADKKDHIGYQIKISAKDNANYKGDIYGYFQIKKADLLVNEKTKFDGFTFNGDTWKWKGGTITNGKMIDGYLYQTDSSGNVVKGMSIVYTGAEIVPSIVGISYADRDGEYHALVKGKEYRVATGDPGNTGDISTDFDTNTNVASATGAVGTRPCVTIRFVPGNKCNFNNYQNFFFNIVKADISKPSQVTVDIPSSITVGDSSAVKLKGYTGKTLSSENYSVKFGKVSSGKVTVTVTGKKNLTGTYSKTVKAKNRTFTKGSGIYKVTSAKKHTLALTKVKKNAKKLVIPSTLKVNGVSYKVTEIKKSACCKARKLKSVVIGKNVKKIGAKAFYKCKKLKRITIKSKLLKKSRVGKKAFSKIAKRPLVKVPKSKLKTYKKLLFKAGLTKRAKVKRA
ncbi:MAG: leucine-rich repeat protein [Coriobacteriales bacterium]|jgi:hypothetical protein